jgi:hypothetical protein
LSNDWGNSFESRFVVIGGCHYQRWGHEWQSGSMSFVSLLDRGLAYFFLHLVHASKFGMDVARHRVASNTTMYHMFSKIVMLIYTSLLDLEDDY